MEEPKGGRPEQGKAATPPVVTLICGGVRTPLIQRKGQGQAAAPVEAVRLSQHPLGIPALPVPVG
jgi:hypothetical protein